MSDTTRVQRWREAKRQNGLQAVTVWLTTSEELRLKDAAVQERCSPSEVMQHAFAQYQARTPSSIGTVPDTSLLQVLIQDALAQWQPPSQSSIGNGTDILLIREMIREELAAMHVIESPVTDTDTDTVTVTVIGALGEGATVAETATLEGVTVTSNGIVADTHVSDTNMSDVEDTQRPARQEETIQVSDTEGTAGQTAVEPQRTRPATRGISQAQHAAIVAEYIRCDQPPYAKFAKHLFDTEFYRAIGNDGREAVVSTSALYRWIQQARKAGML